MASSPILEKYCTPVGGDGKFLCDVRQTRGLESASSYNILDVEEALATAAGNINNSPAQDRRISISTNVNVKNGASETSPEVFPLVLGSLLITASIAFTAFTLFIVLQKWSSNHNNSNKNDGNQEDQDCFREEDTAGREQMKRESSWVFGSAEAGGEEEAIMSWNNLSCSYHSNSKKSRGTETTTALSDVTGHIRYKELVAIMVRVFSSMRWY